MGGMVGAALSLDPQLTLEPTTFGKFEDHLPGSNPEIALGGIAKPGSFIQYFLSPEDNRKKVNETVPSEEMSISDGELYSFTAVGSVPRDR